ncbi:MAG: hypothetical protein KDA60_14045, partial [Planctomycetales bacterium]|nr:hypothetical protein [Planctomycetales bacterium]
VDGRGGNDYVYGNSGNDYLYGGGGDDYLSGSSGNDYLSGSSGNDRMYGHSGNDRIYGYSGDDMIYAGSGDDYVNAYTGNDTVYGESGKDSIYGSNGDDFLDGGDHDDYIDGGSGNDRIEGGNGNDQLRGGGGHDRLYGQSGDDDLEGGSGNDGLFGGTGQDDLNGGTGGDRFIRLYDQSGAFGMNSLDIAEDRTAEDAELRFFNSVDSIFSTYTGKSWTQGEIEEIDEAFDILMQRTGNTRLLKRANGTDFEVFRHGMIQGKPDVMGVNNGQRIAILDGAFDGDASVSTYTMVHEIGHFWDTQGENSFITAFQAESGWEPMPWWGGVPSGHSVSGDGNWIYDTGTDFISSYGWENPREEFAEVFAVNIMLGAGYSVGSGDWADITGVTSSRVNATSDKLAIVDTFLSILS